MSDIKRNEWHLEKKVTLGLIFAASLNLIGTVWQASAINSQVQQNKLDVQRNTQSINSLISGQTNVSERLAKVEAGVSYQIKILDRIEDRLKNK